MASRSCAGARNKIRKVLYRRFVEGLSVTERKLLRWRRGRLGGKRRWDGAGFGAEVSYQLCDLLIGEGVAEGRHLLAAVENLGRDFSGGPGFVSAKVG